MKSTNSFIAVEIKDLVKCILVEFDGTRYINELVDIFEKDQLLNGSYIIFVRKVYILFALFIHLEQHL